MRDSPEPLCIFVAIGRSVQKKSLVLCPVDGKTWAQLDLQTVNSTIQDLTEKSLSLIPASQTWASLAKAPLF